MLKRLLVYTALFCTALIGPAFADYDDSAASEPVQAEIIVEPESIQPNHPFWIALRLTLDENWHIYWKNPGDAGMAPQIEWQLPEGYTVGEVLWPTPHKYTLSDSITYGYENETALLAEITPPANIHGNQEISADIRWVVCDDTSCLPGGTTITAYVPVNSLKSLIKSKNQDFFAKIRAEIPQNHDQASAKKNNNQITLNLHSSGELLEADFFPEDMESIDHTAEIAFANTPNDTEYNIYLKGKDDAADNTSLKGVVVLKSKNNDEITTTAYDINLPLFNETTLRDPHAFTGGLFLALILAFAGGLLLNLMPCVLPVISFKVLSFVKMAGKSKSLILKHGLAFSGGVLISFWILAGILLSLQSYGHAVGWGFQLQEPIFVAILASIIFIFGLSMFGVFEIGAGLASAAGHAQTSNKSSGLMGSFFSGILATAVATPCTGPFLGTAVGFAVTLPPIQGMLIFTMLGLGMASPYLLLAAFPALLKLLPKPGNWMVIFKEMMGFIMIATVLWLVWVFGAQTDALAVFLLLTGFFFMSIACWIYGKWGTPVKKKATRWTSNIIAAIFIAMGAYTLFFASTIPSYNHEESKDSAHNEIAWENFSPKRLAQLKEEGTPVFIDFTAKWCLICQANHLVLSSDAVAKKFEEFGVVRMKADWTRNDAVITEELKKYGRNSVPLYLLYNPKEDSKPEVLPQVLTPGSVIEKLDQIRA